MPPQLALLVCAALVVWLFRRDFRERPAVTGALWIPFFWIFVSGSRFFTSWLDVFGLPSLGGSPEEGSPLDALFFLFLIVSGLRVLYQRQVNWSEFARQNRWVAIYLIYCLVAVLWSDYPFVSVKRWVKLFGQPIMVLIVLTEPNPMQAVERLLKRFAYVVVPVSILFIKYFPQWGSCYDQWNGQRMNTGITPDKNLLGADCFILGLFFAWHLLQVLKWEKSRERRNEIIFCGGFLAGIVWLLYMAHSSSPIAALGLALGVLFFLGLKSVNHYRLGTYLFVGVLGFVIAEYFFSIIEVIIHALGRRTNLTGRTEIWEILLRWDVNPILGMGFESFWLGERLDRLAVILPGLILNEAHNGYLETYIQIGLLGLFFTATMVIATYRKAHWSLLDGTPFARFRLAYLAAFLVYNWTEALFRTHGFAFFIFFLIAIDYVRADSEASKWDNDPAGVHKTSPSASE